MSRVCKEARQKNYKLAISNPCFEVWLCLHLADLDPNDRKSSCFEARLKSILAGFGGYNKTKYNPANFVEETKVMEAIQRAENLDLNPNEYWSSNINSHVYKLVKLIWEAMKEKKLNQKATQKKVAQTKKP